jgi:hypothetical protein
MFEWLSSKKKTPLEEYNDAIEEMAACNKVINDKRLASFSDDLFWKLVKLEVKISRAKKAIQNTSSVAENVVHFNRNSVE